MGKFLWINFYPQDYEYYYTYEDPDGGADFQHLEIGEEAEKVEEENPKEKIRQKVQNLFNKIAESEFSRNIRVMANLVLY